MNTFGHLARRHPRALWLAAAALAVAIAAVIATLVVLDRVRADAAAVPWPDNAESAIVVGDEVLVSPGGDDARPLASVAKLVTALVVLEREPMELGQPGATFVLDPLDELISEQERAAGGVTADIPGGTGTSERMLLETMLVASANDTARSLTRHVFGSEGEFLAQADAWLRDQGLDSIRLADATGLSPHTVGSARDTLALARRARDHPVIAEIAGMPEATLPPTLAGPARTLPATNELLGHFGVTGLKTGYTPDAGHTMAFSTDTTIGVILGAPSPADRDTAIAQLIAHTQSGH